MLRRLLPRFPMFACYSYKYLLHLHLWEVWVWQGWWLSQSYVQPCDVALQHWNGLGVSASWRLCLWPGSWENEYKPTLALLPSGISHLLVSSFPSWLVPPKMGKLSFPTCQVTVSRFYQSYLLLLLVLLLPTASSRSQWALPDFNRECSGSQWALPDPNCELQISVGSAHWDVTLRLRSGSAHDVRECQDLRQVECQIACQIEWQNSMSE